ncbi:AsmA-like C-terminal region-containing protein [Flavobacterium litorale]|uniref:AsmA family protein n=1 Tax=Flavobacterium litorale TaxID=2856519 RepID=A0ABX8V7Z0_9FLAO|nr:AsmA-like C-terminal region-containing protein [Flavobacterium litorale]QYJ68627.1 AsmA family protein [Flavobacterium litorale]
MVKKILKWTGIVLLVLIIALIAAPFLFKGKIKNMVAKAINEQVDATVAFEDVSLSLFSNFPMASVTVDKLSVINKAPFEGDTLVYMDKIDLTMSVNELFKGDGEPMSLKSLATKNGVVNILFNENGVGNFDIAIKNDDTTAADTTKSKPFALNLQDYEIENLRFRYFDAKSKINMVIDSLYHEGHGNFEKSKLDLDTETSANLTLDMDKTNYMRNVHLKLDAVLGLDLENSVYTFKENKALVNQLPLEFDGSIAIVEEGQQYNLTFKTPTSSFKNFLGLIPESYSGSIESVQTEGDFTIDGKVNGLYSENTVPKFNIAIASHNASFKYPNLPKSIQNIVIDTKIVNETGLLNDTYVNLDKLSFRIDKDVFDAKATIRNVVENAMVDADLKGTINLGNLGNAYPIKMDIPLAGILKADVSTKFDMKAVENSQYEKIDNRGSLSLSGFTYSGDGLPKPIQIDEASVQFNPNRVNLSKFNAKTGESDIAVTGTLDNFYGFMFKDQNLQGNFNMNSNKLMVSDFMGPEPVAAAKPEATTEEATPEKVQPKTVAATEAVKIPAFLDCTITAKANTVVYDNLNMKNVSGKMIIKDEAVTLQNLKTSMFDGIITANGNVSTKGAVPTFTMDLDLSTVDIPQTFTQLDMLKSIAPIADVITGKLSAVINVSGNLDSKEMTPDLNSLTGGLGGQLLSTALKAGNSKLLSALDQNVNFIDMDKLKLDNLKANLTFDNGKVNIKPIDLNYKDIPIQVSGVHGFDKSMSYNATFDVPAKYLGSDVNKLLGNSADANNVSVPVTAVITGSFTNPKVKTDLSSAVSSLTKQLIANQKEKLIEKGTDKLKDLIGLGGDKKDADTTKTNDSKDKKDDIKEKAKGILGGFLNKD